MSGLLDRITSLPAGWVYVLVGLIVFAEDAIFVGFVLPGETAAVLGGVTASTGHTSLAVLLIVVAVAAILGDTVGYEVGARYGVRVLRSRVLSKRRDRVDGARKLLARRGGPAVFLGRFVAFFRATMPFLAGTARMPYRTFLAYNAAGGIVWGTAVVLIGYLAGAAYQRVAARFGEISALVVATVAVVALIVYTVRRRRRDRDPNP